MVLSLAGVMAASNLFASMSVTLVDDTSQYSYANGGEFRAVGDSGLDAAVNWSAYSTSTKGAISAADGSSWGGGSVSVDQAYFQTFCIEYNEEFSPGASYSVGVSQKAMYGNNPPDGDPISIGTAWLYSQFAAGALSGYNYAYGDGRTSTAGALQQAIWWLEDESNGSNTGLAGTFLAEAQAAVGGDITRNANGAYGVDALNLGAPGAVQDQLVIVPNELPLPAVPEPGTVIAGMLLLLPFGASTLRILRRNRMA